MNDFCKGFVHGAKEAPKVILAPFVSLWRLLVGSTGPSSTLEKKGRKDQKNNRS
jgi:hypothetical protein